MIWFVVAPILIFYCIFPGGIKRWKKRKEEMQNFENAQTDKIENDEVY